MPNDVKQPVAISFQDYRDEAIKDFFANESRSFQPDVSGLSVGRLRLVGTSRLESRPTAAFRASISLTEGSKNISSSTMSKVTSKPTNGDSKKSKVSTKTTSAKNAKLSSSQSGVSSVQLKTTEMVGAVSLLQDCDNKFISSSDSDSTDNTKDRIDKALSKPVRSIASLSRVDKSSDDTTSVKILSSAVKAGGNTKGEKIKGDKIKNDNINVNVIVRSSGEMRKSNLDLPSIVTPILKPILPLHDRIYALKKKALDGSDALKLVTSQVADMQNEIEDVIENENNNEYAAKEETEINTEFETVTYSDASLKVISKKKDVPDLRVIDIIEQNESDENLDNKEIEDKRNYFNNSRSSIKFDQNLQKLVKAWSQLSNKVKDKIISLALNAEKDKKS